MAERPTKSSKEAVRKVRLTAYLAGGGAAVLAARESDAVIISNTTEQPFGINEEVNIDLNSDGQVDLQIDHDRVVLPGGGGALGDYDNSSATAGNDLVLWQRTLGSSTPLPNDNGLGTPIDSRHLDLWQTHFGASGASGTAVDYLQIDKNDVNSAANPIPTDFETTFPLNGTVANDTAQTAYVTSGENTGYLDDLGGYPQALQAGQEIGFNSFFDFQEGDNFAGTGNTIRANRLIDEDQGQVDQHPDFGNNPNVALPQNGPNWVGLGGEIRYVGFKVNLNDAIDEATLIEVINYGWIGIRIDNEADATGAVTGWAYETEHDVPIQAGDTGGGASVIPEPTTLAAALGGVVFATLLGIGRRR